MRAALLPQRAAVRAGAVEVLVGDGQAGQRDRLGQGDAVRPCAAAAATRRPIRTRRPGVHQSCGSDSMIAWAGTVAGSRPGCPATAPIGVAARADLHRDRRGGVLALVLAHLPLAAEQPGRVGELGGPAPGEVALVRVGLEPAARRRRSSVRLQRGGDGARWRAAGRSARVPRTGRPGRRGGPSGRARARGSRPGSAPGWPGRAAWRCEGGTASRMACCARAAGASKPNAAPVRWSAAGITSSNWSRAAAATRVPGRAEVQGRVGVDDDERPGVLRAGLPRVGWPGSPMP